MSVLRQAVRVMAGVVLATGLGGAAGAEGEATGAVAAQPDAGRAAALSAPATVDAGQRVAVGVAAAAPGARLELWGPIVGEGRGPKVSSTPAQAPATSLEAPQEPGSYVLTLVSPEGRELASAPFEVAGISVTIRAPDRTGVGSQTEVRWRGPGRAGDWLQFVEIGSGAVLSEAPAVGRAGVENATYVLAPMTPGLYELRYWSGARQAALNRLLIEVQSSGAGVPRTID